MLATAVVATLNEEKHIARCLQALLNQRGLSGELEILVFDGGSEDRTVEIVRSFPEFGSRIRLFQNPQGFQVFAYNRGIRAARAPYVWFVVAHADFAEDYLAEAIALLEKLDAANVGGMQRAVGNGSLTRAIAFAMSSPFGVGGATYRYVDRERYTDSVFMGVARRECLLQIGGFNEDVPFDEDTDLNIRLRIAGYRVATSPKLRCNYYVRSTLPALAKQMFRYGFWRRKSQMHFGGGIPLRVLAPPALVLGLLASPLLPAPLCWLTAGLYALFLSAATAVAVRRIDFLAFLVPPVLVTMHVAYGIGWLTGLFSHKRTRPQGLTGALASDYDLQSY